MNLFCCLTIFLLLYHKSVAINQGYGDCLFGTGQQTPLLLQDGLRCVQVQPETRGSWDLAMDLCNSRQGHLLHVYSSEEAKLVNAWLIERSISSNPYIGQKKIGPLNGNYTGFNVKWFLTKTENIGIDQSYQYYQYSLWGVGGTNSESMEYGVTWGSGTKPWEWGYGTFSALTTTRKILCQFVADQRPSGKFQAQRGKRSLAPVYDISEQKHSTLCGIQCINQPWCMGFNSVGNGNGVICEMIAVKQNDTQAGLTEENGASYYERTKG